MCGIVGYVGPKAATPLLVAGLRKLEYRGYDSAGLAVTDEGRMQVVRCRGKLSGLEDMVAREPPPGSVGVGHTRWATHGRPVGDQRAPAQDRLGRGRAQRHHREPPGAARAAGSGGAQVLVGDRHRDRAHLIDEALLAGAPTPGGGGAHGAARRSRARTRWRSCPRSTPVRSSPRRSRRRCASASARARPSSRPTSRPSSSTRARSSSSTRATSPRSPARASS